MGAKKLYEEEILRLVKKLPEQEMASVVSFITEKVNLSELEAKLKLEFNPNDLSHALEIIEQGYWANKISNSDEFSKTKQREKEFDL